MENNSWPFCLTYLQFFTLPFPPSCPKFRVYKEQLLPSVLSCFYAPPQLTIPPPLLHISTKSPTHPSISLCISKFPLLQVVGIKSCISCCLGMRKTTFSGTTVFLSRNLVHYEAYDAVHDTLKLNGAQVYLCSDHTRNSSNEYHVISDHLHDKFDFFKSKGCNLLGPQCILSCAKEHRILPKQSYTCCLAMDGVKVLASGFERDEKAVIEQMVTAMGGVLQAKATFDVNFVIVKDVLAAKYKHAINVLKKPVVSLEWLYQCWKEHRVVPHEQFRILPFTGLIVCVTRIPLDERNEVERLIVQNGGRYSGNLTRKCTHLVSDAPVGDKYSVAQSWGHIHIVTRKWVDQSIAKRVCLDEGLYHVARTPSLSSGPNNIQQENSYQEISNAFSQPQSCPITEDLEATSLSNIASITEAQPTTVEIKDDPTYDCGVAEDSEAEDNDRYLSDCRIFLVGFEEKEHSKLVNMIRKGGGTRHMLLRDELTHIVFGKPSEDEKREIRHLAAWGVINVVKSLWLEECDKTKKELPVFPRHSASELLVSKEPSFKVSNVKKAVTSDGPAFKGKMFSVEPSENSRRVTEKPRCVTNNIKSNAEAATKSSNPTILKANGLECIRSMKSSSCIEEVTRRPSDVFKAKSFCFSSSFPLEQRPEVMEWIKEGGGVLANESSKVNVDYIIERHGLPQFDISLYQSTVVSTHWIRSSLDEGLMLDTKSHILYTPLCCCIPFPGFECFRFCVSQYEEKERLLLKNLCIVLGAKFSSKLTKKATHLLCKFANGPKYEAACKWGIQSVSADWIEKCVTQGKVAPLDLFGPRAVTTEDREAGLCTATQYPTQAAAVFSGHSQSQASIDLTTDGKRPRLQELNSTTNLAKKNKLMDDASGGSKEVVDVADAIEDLLAHSNVLPSPSGREQCVRFSSRHSPVIDQSHANPHSTYQNLNQRSNRTNEQNLIPDPDSVGSERKGATFDSFSETQSELQVVGYEEDLTGRQKIIDRVRSQSLNSPPGK